MAHKYKQHHNCQIIQQKEEDWLFKIKKHKLTPQKHIAANISSDEGIYSIKSDT